MGQARFAPDITLPGMIYGKIIRSPHAHARIVNIDTSRAQAMDGVYAVVTAADLGISRGSHRTPRGRFRQL